jgi:glycosyltransferase involved in cell wall biosynthesis
LSRLRILMVSDVPWRRELGAARGQIELAEELRKLGHVVDKFDHVDAFGDETPKRWHRLFPLRFARRARAYLRAHGHEFDVIEALPGDLPFAKGHLGYKGLLVARSMGLHPLYEDYIRYERATWPDRIPGTILGKTLHRFTVRRRSELCRRSLRTADLVKVLNADEEAYVSRTLGLGHKSVTVPDGLADGFADALARAARPPKERLRRSEVVFIGAWSLRKGAADWREIVATARRLVPNVRFRFLGTGCDRSDVLADVGSENADAVSVLPHFDPDQLPVLLASATAGALPSYVEGLPFSVLEQLGAGLPTVAYDAPGSRAILDKLTQPLMARPGDVRRFAELLAQVLALNEESYGRLASECVAVSRAFRYSTIAHATLEAYDAARDRIGLDRERDSRTKPPLQAAAGGRRR